MILIHVSYVFSNLNNHSILLIVNADLPTAPKITGNCPIWPNLPISHLGDRKFPDMVEKSCKMKKSGVLLAWFWPKTA